MLIQSEIPGNAGSQQLKPMHIFSTYLTEEASQQQTLQSFRNNIVYNPRTVPKTVYYIKIHIKIYLQSFVTNYHLYHLICFESSTKVFFTTQRSH